MRRDHSPRVVSRRLLGLPTGLRLATLSRNITSPLAMAICSMVGADLSLAIAIVVMTGVMGANFGATVLDALGYVESAVKGKYYGVVTVDACTWKMYTS